MKKKIKLCEKCYMHFVKLGCIFIDGVKYDRDEVEVEIVPEEECVNNY